MTTHSEDQQDREESSFEGLSVEDIYKAPSILLAGMPGTGKTHAIRTLLDAGLEVFVLFTEPGMEVLADTDPDQLHWHYVPPSSGDWESMIKHAENANRLHWDVLVKTIDSKKKSYDSAVKFLRAFADFPCDRTGKTYGDVCSWGPDKGLVLDSLTGLNYSAMQLIVGQAYGVSLPQYGAAMKTQLNFVNKLTLDTNCIFVMTAHLERIIDEVNGGMTIQVNALGKKNAPEIPKNFSDVILCKRDKGKFIWATESPGADLKARNVPWAAEITPSFVPLIQTWKDRVAAAGKGK